MGRSGGGAGRREEGCGVVGMSGEEWEGTGEEQGGERWDGEECGGEGRSGKE